MQQRSKYQGSDFFQRHSASASAPTTMVPVQNTDCKPTAESGSRGKRSVCYLLLLPSLTFDSNTSHSQSADFVFVSFFFVFYDPPLSEHRRPPPALPSPAPPPRANLGRGPLGTCMSQKDTSCCFSLLPSTSVPGFPGVE